MDDPLYQHRQTGWLIITLCGSFAVYLVIFALTVLHGWGQILTVAGACLCGLFSWLFSSLTVTIEGGEVRHFFGPGFHRKAWPLHEIRTVKRIRTSVFSGWGIHWSTRGWLYNVSGFDAVQVEMWNGKHLCIGADEPAVLLHALEEHVPHRAIDAVPVPPAGGE